ncbi:MAG: zinc-binding dehydrogenase [Beijerinckiaceae bacterium]|nr:MAG: zinc-binding dehydrogenase [Beijerinckiaceae bacterium]
MRQISVLRPGGFRALRIVEAAPPMPSPGMVVIDVDAAGVNFADCVARLGLYASSWRYAGWPFTPGFEVAGRVSALGEGVRGLEIGERVIALTRFGGYAEQVAVPRHQVFACPSRLTTPQAAGIAVVFLTAAYALDELAAPRPGSTVLVHSAAGGVGGALLQLARLRGIHAVGVVGSTHKLQAAKDAGAHAVIDASSENWFAAARHYAPNGYRAVFDANGLTLRQSLRLLAPMGRLVVYGAHGIIPRGGKLIGALAAMLRYALLPRFGALRLASENKSVMAFNLSYLFDEVSLLDRIMCSLLTDFEEGSLVPPPTRCYPFEQAGLAHRDVQSGLTIGKCVLTVGSVEANLTRRHP